MWSVDKANTIAWVRTIIVLILGRFSSEWTNDKKCARIVCFMDALIKHLTIIECIMVSAGIS